MEFEGGATGTLQASWLAGGHKMDIGFAVHGTRGSIEFTSEEPTEVRLYKTSDPAAESGFRAIPVGPAHPGAELFWPVPGMALGFGDGFIIAVRDLLASIAEGRPASPTSSTACARARWSRPPRPRRRPAAGRPSSASIWTRHEVVAAAGTHRN